MSFVVVAVVVVIDVTFGVLICDRPERNVAVASPGQFINDFYLFFIIVIVVVDVDVVKIVSSRFNAKFDVVEWTVYENDFRSSFSRPLVSKMDAYYNSTL